MKQPKKFKLSDFGTRAQAAGAGGWHGLLSVSVVAYRNSRQELQRTVASLAAAVEEARANLRFAEGQEARGPQGTQTTKQKQPEQTAQAIIQPTSEDDDAVHLLIVDNSEDGRIDETWFNEIKTDMERAKIKLEVESGHGNIGYAMGNNKSLYRYSHWLHLILNPDVEMQSDCLRVGIEYMLHNEDVALTCPYAEDFKGRPQYLCKRYPSLLTLFLRGFMPGFLRPLFRQRLDRYEMRDLPTDRATEGVPMVSGCFMLCRRDAMVRMGGFDPRYFLYFEDFAFSMNIAHFGPLVYLPTMRIKHRGGNAAGKGPKHIAMFIRSAFRFFGDHGWRILKE